MNKNLKNILLIFFRLLQLISINIKMEASMAEEQNYNRIQIVLTTDCKTCPVGP